MLLALGTSSVLALGALASPIPHQELTVDSLKARIRPQMWATSRISVFRSQRCASPRPTSYMQPGIWTKHNRRSRERGGLFGVGARLFHSIA